jgi:hypothetical protein
MNCRSDHDSRRRRHSSSAKQHAVTSISRPIAAWRAGFRSALSTTPTRSTATVVQGRASRIPRRLWTNLSDVRYPTLCGLELHIASGPTSARNRSDRHHSMTLSGRTRTESGTLRLSAAAVLRFKVRSNVTGCSTGSSVGTAPLNILPTYCAVFRNNASGLAP